MKKEIEVPTESVCPKCGANIKLYIKEKLIEESYDSDFYLIDTREYCPKGCLDEK